MQWFWTVCLFVILIFFSILLFVPFAFEIVRCLISSMLKTCTIVNSFFLIKTCKNLSGIEKSKIWQRVCSKPIICVSYYIVWMYALCCFVLSFTVYCQLPIFLTISFTLLFNLCGRAIRNSNPNHVYKWLSSLEFEIQDNLIENIMCNALQKKTREQQNNMLNSQILKFSFYASIVFSLLLFNLYFLNSIALNISLTSIPCVFCFLKRSPLLFSVFSLFGRYYKWLVLNLFKMSSICYD